MDDRRPTIAYQPALDGVRALAVVAVLLFHAGVAGFGGGYLGVSVFFTLSGYLITSLLAQEHATSGRIDLQAFYARRLRRLLPASAVTLAAIVVLAKVTDWFDGVDGLRAQVVGATLQVANWVFLAGSGSYQNLLAQTAGAASPLEHFWSLSIEEQFYWIWPPFITVLFARVRGARRRLRAVAAVTLASMLAAPAIAVVWGPDAAYWATPARIGEILVGAWLALAVRAATGTGRTLDAAWRWAAPGCLGLLAVAVITFPSSGGPAYHGGLPLVALVSGGLIVGLQVDGPVRRALSWNPLVWLGKISYGVYLFHWPLFVLLDEQRTGLDGIALLAVRLGATLAISVVSYAWFESPIRRSRGRRVLTFGGALAATTLVAVAAVAFVPVGLGEYWKTDAATAEAAAIVPDGDQPLTALAASTSSTTTTTAPSTTVPAAGQPGTTVPGVDTTATTSTSSTTTTTIPPIPALARPVRVIVVGDSTANAVGTGVVAWAAEHPELAQAQIVAQGGCGFLEGGERAASEHFGGPASCDGWADRSIYPVVSELHPDVVVVMVTTWDLLDRKWTTDELLTPMDDEYGLHLLGDYSKLVDGLLAAGAGKVALVREPIPDVFWTHDFSGQNDPARHQVMYSVFDQVSQDRADVRVIDLAGWFTAHGYDTNEEARPDGIHLEPTWSQSVSEQFLGDEIVRVALGLPGEWSDSP